MSSKLTAATQHKLGTAIEGLADLLEEKQTAELLHTIEQTGKGTRRLQKVAVDMQSQHEVSGADPESLRWEVVSPRGSLTAEVDSVRVAIAQNIEDRNLVANVYTDAELLAQVPLHTGSVTDAELAEYESLFNSATDPQLKQSIAHLAEAIDDLDKDAEHTRSDLLVKLTDKLTPSPLAPHGTDSKLVAAAKQHDALHSLHDTIEKVGHIASPNALAVGAATAESLSHGSVGEALSATLGVSPSALEGIAHSCHLAAEALHGVVAIIDAVHVIRGLRSGANKTDIALDGSRAALAALSVTAGFVGWPALVGIGLSLGIVGVTVAKIVRGKKRHTAHRRQAGAAYSDLRHTLNRMVETEKKQGTMEISRSGAHQTMRPSPGLQP